MKKKHLIHLAIFAIVIAFGITVYGGSKGTTEIRSSEPLLACDLSVTIPTPTPTPPTTTPTPINPTPTPKPTPIICKNKTDIALVFDRSNTMNRLESDNRKKIEWVKEAATGLVDAVQKSGNTNVRLSVSDFGRQGNDGLGIHSPENNSIFHLNLSSDYNLVKSSISKVKYINNGTCILCGIRLGNLSLYGSPNNKYQILLSDGMANKNWNGSNKGTSAGNPTTNAIAEANLGRASGINYFVLGYGKKPKDIDEKTLKLIAGTDANYSYKPNATDWSAAFLEILGKICK